MKLVRDKIPELIENAGEWCLCRSVHGIDEKIVFLRNKMTEEIAELIEDPSYEEAADVLEVLREFINIYDLDFATVQETANAKKQTHGGFSKGIVLQKVGKDLGKM